MKINFANRNQVVIYECELKGQISDGKWENAPGNHWKNMCAARATCDDIAPVGVYGFTPSRKYNFTDKMLLDVVGERMIFWVKLYTAFPQLHFEDHWDYDVTDTVSLQGEYWAKKRDEVLADTGCETIENFLSKVAAVDYDAKALRADLLQMKAIVNERS